MTLKNPSPPMAVAGSLIYGLENVAVPTITHIGPDMIVLTLT